MIKVLTFASCGAHDPLHVAADRGHLPHLYRWLGFAQTPYALSSGAALQLRAMCLGERDLEPAARLLAYMETHQPGPGTRHLVDASEILFVELSTPVEPMLGEAVVNLNRVADYVLDPLRGSSAPPRLVHGWINALVQVAPDLRDRATALLAAWPDELAEAPLARETVERLWSRRLTIDDMVADLRALRERVPGPLVIKLFDFRYMPDGRAIDWPAGFRAEQLEVARRLDAPVIDFAPLVRVLGSGRGLIEDGGMNHLRPEVHPAAAEIVHDALAGALGRPPLRDDPDWRAEAPALFAATPEFMERPLRESLPEAFVNGPAPAPSPRGARPTLRAIAREVNAALVELHAERLAEFGVRDSGLFDHYARIVAGGQLVGARERQAAMIIETYLAEHDGHAVLRAGLGELALLIAARGRPALALEPHPLRRQAIEVGARRLAAQGLIRSDRLRIEGLLVPAAPPEGRVLGIALGAAQVAELEQTAPFWPAIGRFASLLIERRTFLTLRDTAERLADLDANLRRLAFTRRRDFPFASLSAFEREA